MKLTSLRAALLGSVALLAAAAAPASAQVTPPTIQQATGCIAGPGQQASNSNMGYMNNIGLGLDASGAIGSAYLTNVIGSTSDPNGWAGVAINCQTPMQVAEGASTQAALNYLAGLITTGGGGTGGGYAGFNIATQTGSGAVPSGGTVTIAPSNGNLTTSGGGTSVTIGLNPDLNVNSVTANSFVAGGASLTAAGLNNGGNVISGVAPGAAGTDAVNVNQLNAVKAMGYTFAGNDGVPATLPLGSVLAITGTGSTAGNYSSSNIKTSVLPTSLVPGGPATGTIDIQMTDQPTFGATTINAGGTGKITGVTAGSTAAGSTEAVNGSQINTLGTSIANNFGGGSIYDPTTGKVTAPTYNVAGGTYNNVGDALGAVDGRVTNVYNQIQNGTIGLVQQTGGAPGSGTITVGAATGGTLVDFTGTDGARVLTGVADGAVAAGSKDAVNGGQLYAVQQLASKGWDLGNGVVAGSNGQSSGSTTNIAPGGKATFSAGQNIVLKQVGAEMQIAVRDDPTFKGMVTAQGGVNVTGGGFTVAGGQNVSFGGNVLHDVGAGVLPTDGANIGQLKAVGDSVAAGLGGGATANSVGVVSAPTYALGSGTYHDVGSALGGLNTTQINAGNSTATIVGGGSIYDPTTGKISAPSIHVGGTVYTQITPAIEAADKKIDASGQSQASNLGGGATYNSSTGAVSAPTYNVGGATYNNVGSAIDASNKLAVQYNPDANGQPTNTVTLLGDRTGKPVTVTNVAPGALNRTSTDAVNGSQLWDATRGGVQYDRGPNGEPNYNSVTFNPGGSPTGLHNVARGVAPTDAVNKAQLDDLANWTANGFNQLSGDLRRLKRDAFGGIAAANALAALKFTPDPGRWVVQAAAGGYKNAAAVAAGLAYRAENGNTMVNAGVSWQPTTKNVGWNVGIGYQF